MSDDKPDWQLIAEALKYVEDMEREAWELAGELGDQENSLDGKAINLAVHLGRGANRLKDLAQRHPKPFSLNVKGDGWDMKIG